MEIREIRKACKMGKEKQTEPEKNNTVIAKLTVKNIADGYAYCDVELIAAGLGNKQRPPYDAGQTGAV